jgi:hypothetical protein
MPLRCRIRLTGISETLLATARAGQRGTITTWLERTPPLTTDPIRSTRSSLQSLKSKIPARTQFECREVASTHIALVGS